MTKDLIDAIRGRRSVRDFKSDPIPDPTIGRILEAGRLAPSAGNIEPWFFYVVKNPEVKRELAQFSEPWIEKAPVVIVVTADYDAEKAEFGQRGRDMYVLQDTAAATQNMLLAAYGFGIGSCWVGKFDENAISQILQIPMGRRPVVLIPLGYPAQEKTEPVPHKAMDDIVQVIH